MAKKKATKSPSSTSPKKKAPKKAAKKAPKKAAKKTAKKKASKKKESGGLSGSQVKVLNALKNTAKGKKELSRVELSAATGINKGWSKLLGSSTKSGLGMSGNDSLEGQGFIGSSKYEGSRSIVYYITAAGKKAIQ